MATHSVEFQSSWSESNTFYQFCALQKHTKLSFSQLAWLIFYLMYYL